MTRKIKWTVVLLIIRTLVGASYRFFQGPLEAKWATGQLDDSVASYAASSSLAQGSIVNWVSLVFLIAIVVVWIPSKNKRKNRST